MTHDDDDDDDDAGGDDDDDDHNDNSRDDDALHMMIMMMMQVVMDGDVSYVDVTELRMSREYSVYYQHWARCGYNDTRLVWNIWKSQEHYENSGSENN